MARARLLKPGFFKNPDLGVMPPIARLLFAGLWTIADREGRLKDDPLVIKGELFPYETCDVDELLNQLAKKRFIVRYRAQTNRYISIANFLKHQTPHIREADSQIPEPHQKHEASTVLAPDKHRTRTAFSGTSPAVTGNRYTEADPVAVAVNARAADPEEKEPGYDADSFEAIYAKHYTEQNAGRFLAPIVRTECNRLEREFGRDACIDVAEAYAWEKHPNYLREVLNDPKRSNRTQREPDADAGPLDNLPAGIRAEILRSGALKPVVVDLD